MTPPPRALSPARSCLQARRGMRPRRGQARRARSIWSNFIYTRCPTVCSALGAEYTRMQRTLRARFGANSPVRLVSIAFDRAHDTPAALQGYATTHQQEADLWQIGTPVNAAAQNELLQSLGVVAVPDGMGGFVHNGAIHLIDASGTVRGIYALDQWPQALERALILAGARRT